MGQATRGLVSRRVGLAGVVYACLVLACAHANPARAVANDPIAFIASAISPRAGYYGQCSNELPIGVTVLASLESPLSLNVKLRYQYFRSDPRAPSSPILSKAMPLNTSSMYMAAIGVSDEAPEYLKGSDGSLRYQIEATNPSGDVVRSQTASVGVHFCSASDGVAAQFQQVRAGR